jgi:hypothetical protein
MEGSITWVGIDAHKKTFAVAVLAAHAKAEELTVENTESAILKLARRLVRQAKASQASPRTQVGELSLGCLPGNTLRRSLDAPCTDSQSGPPELGS